MTYELRRVRGEHEVAIYEFEVANRDYFTQSISDRGDDFFATFPERHRELLAEQEAGTGAFFVLVDVEGTVVGRFNLYDLDGESADVGYRVAQRVSGRGVATSALQNLVRIARDDFGLRILIATVTNDNVASRRVLENARFVFVGPTIVAGREGLKFELPLASPGRLS